MTEIRDVLRGRLNEVLASKKSFISDRINFVSLGVALLVNIIHWVILYIKIKPTQQNVVLHYNVVYGSDLVDKASFVYFIPGFALLILILNVALALIFFRREKLAAHFLNIASIAVQLIFLAATLSLIVINE